MLFEARQLKFLWQALLQENERLRSECDRNKDELENENEGRRLWHSKFKNLDATFKVSQPCTNTVLRSLTTQASRPFVVAILDGDGVLFKDESYQAVKDGGSLAAQSLETGIRNYVGTTLAIEGGYDLVVHIYVNLAGFGNKLVK